MTEEKENAVTAPTKLQSLEDDALRGDKEALALVISALRRYRQAAQLLLSRRYSDGAVDGATLYSFDLTVEDIENLEGGE